MKNRDENKNNGSNQTNEKRFCGDFYPLSCVEWGDLAGGFVVKVGIRAMTDFKGSACYFHNSSITPNRM